MGDNVWMVLLFGVFPLCCRTVKRKLSYKCTKVLKLYKQPSLQKKDEKIAPPFS